MYLAKGADAPDAKEGSRNRPEDDLFPPPSDNRREKAPSQDQGATKLCLWCRYLVVMFLIWPKLVFSSMVVSEPKTPSIAINVCVFNIAPYEELLHKSVWNPKRHWRALPRLNYISLNESLWPSSARIVLQVLRRLEVVAAHNFDALSRSSTGVVKSNLEPLFVATLPPIKSGCVKADVCAQFFPRSIGGFDGQFLSSGSSLLSRVRCFLGVTDRIFHDVQLFPEHHQLDKGNDRCGKSYPRSETGDLDGRALAIRLGALLVSVALFIGLAFRGGYLCLYKDRRALGAALICLALVAQASGLWLWLTITY